jgi:NAD(P)-dependent dehydrogenase (short-subunit alcohol dehydrogenase family)
VAEAVPTDVTSEAEIDNLFAKTIARFGRVDILVNNAGLFNGAPLDQTKTDAFDAVINTGIRGSFLCTRAAFRIMKEQGGGRIINMGSISAQRSRQNNVAYTTAKFGLTGLTHSTALEGRDYGITCGILHPGQVHTRPNMPANMPGMTVEEIAAAAVYMAAQPPKVNVFELIQLPIDQPYLGRG